jgi:hypothetical protein
MVMVMIKRILGPLGLVLLAASATAADGPQTFGRALEGLPVSTLESVLARPEAGKRVRLEGMIGKVCTNKGCWLELRQGGKTVHVTFAGYSFFVPKDSAGKLVALEGKVVIKEPSAEEIAHKKGEGAGESVAAKVKVEAAGVEIRGE